MTVISLFFQCIFISALFRFNYCKKLNLLFPNNHIDWSCPIPICKNKNINKSIHMN